MRVLHALLARAAVNGRHAVAHQCASKRGDSPRAAGSGCLASRSGSAGTAQRPSGISSKRSRRRCRRSVPFTVSTAPWMMADHAVAPAWIGVPAGQRGRIGEITRSMRRTYSPPPAGSSVSPAPRPPLRPAIRPASSVRVRLREDSSGSQSIRRFPPQRLGDLLRAQPGPNRCEALPPQRRQRL